MSPIHTHTETEKVVVKSFHTLVMDILSFKLFLSIVVFPGRLSLINIPSRTKRKTHKKQPRTGCTVEFILDFIIIHDQKCAHKFKYIYIHPPLIFGYMFLSCT